MRDHRPRNQHRRNKICCWFRNDAFATSSGGVGEIEQLHLASHDEDAVEVWVRLDDGIEIRFEIVDVPDVDLDSFETGKLCLRLLSLSRRRPLRLRSYLGRGSALRMLRQGQTLRRG